MLHEVFEHVVDLLVCAEPSPRGRLERMREFDEVESGSRPSIDEAWESGVHRRLSPIVRTPEELEGSGLPALRHRL